MSRTITTETEREEGFTLIELMVVVLIIGILMAIAIPTFLSAKNTANARAAQENVRNALSNEAAYYANNQSYDLSESDMHSQEPGIPFYLPAANVTYGTAVFAVNNVVISYPSGSTNEILLTANSSNNNQCYSVLTYQGQTVYAITTYASSVCGVPSTWTTSWGGAAASLPTGASAPASAFVVAS